jgi:hypothetical protein
LQDVDLAVRIEEPLLEIVKRHLPEG